MPKLYILFLSLIGCFLSISPTVPAPDFYRTPIFFGRPHSVCPWKWSIETTAFAGNSSKGFNSHGQTTSLLSIYGAENIKDLAEGVPDAILNKNDSILNTLFSQETGPNFGKICWGGTIENFEWDATFIQDLTDGFFLELFIPYRSIDLSNITYQDLSNLDDAGTVNVDDWKSFINTLFGNLNQYGVRTNKTSTSGLGDIVALIGWSFCLYDSCMLSKWKVNAIETTLKFGVSFPTSNVVPYNQLFEFSRGYNGHYAFPLTYTGTIYFRKWIYFGAHISGIFFGSDTKCIGMKTASDQNGWIKLAHGKAKIDRGPIWTIGGYLQSIIFPKCSFIVAYGYTEEEKTLLSPCDCTTFDCNTVNHDIRYDSWNFHMFHFLFEYDCTTQHHPNAPYINVFIAKPFKGERVFDTTLFGFTFGVNCQWRF